MRIGILTSSLSGGGAERQAQIWARLCAFWGHEVTAIVLWPRKDDPDLHGVRVVHLPKASGVDLATVSWRLRGFARELDALIAFEPYLGVCTMLSLPRIPWMIVTGKVPYVLRADSRIPTFAFKQAFERATNVSAPNGAMVDCYRRLGIRPRRPWLVVPNIADPDAFVESSADRRGVLWVGRLDPIKNPLLAVESAAAAGAPLTIIGHGALQQDVERACVAGKSEPVTLEGFSGRPWDAYARHRVLVVTSRYESFGNVIVESLAARTPVVSVDCDFGPREIIGDAVYSHLTEPDVEAVSAGLRQVLERPYTEAEGTECRLIADRYRPAAVAPLVAEAIDGLL